MPLAEHSGLDISIGRWVLASACADRKDWAGGVEADELKMSVDVSSRQLMSAGYVAGVDEILTETSTNPRYITLQVTDSLTGHDVERVGRVLHELKQLGVKIALDDFGTGQSSLSCLKVFPVDTLKIDRAFIGDIDTDPDSNLIVGSVIALAHGMHVAVVAEGIETASQYRAAARLGCDECQGSFFADPMDSTDFRSMMDSPTADGNKPAWRDSGVRDLPDLALVATSKGRPTLRG